MSALTFNKNIAFSIVLLVIIGAILNKVIPPQVDAVLPVVISKNRVSISDIHQQRDIEISKTVMVDRIDLADKSRFRHAKLGDIGYSGDFFCRYRCPLYRKSGR